MSDVNLNSVNGADQDKTEVANGEQSKLKRACDDPEGWCANCGCGHDRAGLAHLPTCSAASAMNPAVDGDVHHDGIGYFSVPVGLHPDTATLVAQFASALASKLRKSEAKYGYSDGWRRDDWQGELVTKLMEHVQKGDPRDVAAYCAFAWFHGWSVNPAPKA